MTVYEFKGTEVVSETREPCSCGTAIITEYRVNEELVRRDIRIEVSREAMGGLCGLPGNL